jgi:tyrosyl-tRNA synthetase
MSGRFIDELKWRGLFHQCTDEAGLRAHLDCGSRKAYVGFDPTADSLTIGNLVPIMMLRHLQFAGHTPVVVMGGGTGLIGDPSGKEAERQLRTREEIEANVQAQRRIFEPLLDLSKSTKNRAVVVNNIDWLEKLSYIEALRDIGKHFSINMMIQKESVRERLHNRDQGISYTEFSYMILQAYDFLHLYREQGVTLQMGGSDQWGNIVAGADLIRRVLGPDWEQSRQQTGRLDVATAEFAGYPEASKSFGLTAPLVAKADGGKFGKTESGAVWLTADRSSPYAFYQFWLRTDDKDVVPFLKLFTLLPHDQIDALAAAHTKDPGAREAHRALARHMTEMLHGPSEREQAEAAARALFSGDVSHLPLRTLEEAFATAPNSAHDKAHLQRTGVPLVDVLAQTSLAKSRGQARQLLTEGAVSVNGHKAAPDARLTTATLLHGSVILLRRGKSAWHVTKWG